MCLKDTGESKAKTRPVVIGFTDPDMTEIRSQSPTLRRLSRQLILHISASRRFHLKKGDVKTAFLSGDREEAKRDVYAEPPQELGDNLQITREVGNCCVRFSKRIERMVEKNCA